MLCMVDNVKTRVPRLLAFAFDVRHAMCSDWRPWSVYCALSEISAIGSILSNLFVYIFITIIISNSIMPSCAL